MELLHPSSWLIYSWDCHLESTPASNSGTITCSGSKQASWTVSTQPIERTNPHQRRRLSILGKTQRTFSANVFSNSPTSDRGDFINSYLLTLPGNGASLYRRPTSRIRRPVFQRIGDVASSNVNHGRTGILWVTYSTPSSMRPVASAPSHIFTSVNSE